MPVFVKKRGDVLKVSLGGFDSKDEFGDNLARVKRIAGRRWNGDEKVWELPADAATAMRLVQTVEPVLDAETQAMVRMHADEVADSLLTRLNPDAQLQLPWAEYLLPFQRSGIDFMAKHGRTILADDMGLGKTVEALATIEEHRLRTSAAELPVLIVAPASTLGGWKDTIEHGPRNLEGELIVPPEHWPNWKATIISGKNPAARRRDLEGTERFTVVNWEKLRLMPELRKIKWGANVADEAHRAKNKDAQQTQALWKLKAPVQIAATGTPVMANPADLWSLLRWLVPEQYAEHVKGGGYWPFYYNYVDDYATKMGRVVLGVKNEDALRFELADKLVRRTKAQVLTDLPAKTRSTRYVELLPAQRRLYEAAEEELLLDIEAAMSEGGTHSQKVAAAIEAGSIPTLMLLIRNGAARIMRLRQIASSPALLGGEDVSAKFNAVEEIVRDAPGRPFVIFTWFRDSARLIAERLEKGKHAPKVGIVAGDADPTDTVRAFQEGELDHLVCTIAKGGTGLTMTRASEAIFTEIDWTPAINEQAEDRLHRLGQKSAVSIIRIMAADSVDTNRVGPKNRLKELITRAVTGDPAILEENPT